MEKKMNIKRAFIGMTALMLLPAVAFAQPIPVTPAPGTALIMVQKVFTDGNDETEVTLTVQCTSGTVAPTSVTVLPGEGVEHAFVISNIPLGPDNVCTVKETEVDGYYAQAECGPAEGDPDEDCLPSASDDDRLDYCLFNNVQSDLSTDQKFGDVARCQLFNYPTPVKVEITKTWDISGAGGNDYDRDAIIVAECDGYILENDDYYGCQGPFGPMSGNANKSCSSWISFELDDSDGDYEDKDGDDVGMAKRSFMVVPRWYPTATNPKDQDYTLCSAWEEDVASAVEVDDTDCYEMEVSLGSGNSCTITNTLFFEGIPTLNQYGMAIMALLMLGVGFVGFRRFV